MAVAIKQNAIVEIFEVLFGENSKIKQIPAALDDKTGFVAGKYIDQEGKVKGWLVGDLAFAAGASAALTMIPPDTVKEAIAVKQLSGNLLDNLGEVMNICASLFQGVIDQHIRFEKLQNVAGDKEIFADATMGSTNFEIQLPRYGAGRITLRC